VVSLTRGRGGDARWEVWDSEIECRGWNCPVKAKTGPVRAQFQSRSPKVKQGGVEVIDENGPLF